MFSVLAVLAPPLVAGSPPFWAVAAGVSGASGCALLLHTRSCLWFPPLRPESLAASRGMHRAVCRTRTVLCVVVKAIIKY